MPKGTYDVQRDNSRRRSDPTFSSFVCPILIFSLLCIVVTLIGNWDKITGKQPQSTWQSNGNAKNDAETVKVESNTVRAYEKLRDESLKNKFRTTHALPTTMSIKIKEFFHYKTTHQQDNNDEDYNSKENYNKFPVKLTSTTTTTPSTLVHPTKPHKNNNKTNMILDKNITELPTDTTKYSVLGSEIIENTSKKSVTTHLAEEYEDYDSKTTKDTTGLDDTTLNNKLLDTSYEDYEDHTNLYTHENIGSEIIENTKKSATTHLADEYEDYDTITIKDTTGLDDTTLDNKLLDNSYEDYEDHTNLYTHENKNISEFKHDHVIETIIEHTHNINSSERPTISDSTYFKWDYKKKTSTSKNNLYQITTESLEKLQSNAEEDISTTELFNENNTHINPIQLNHTNLDYISSSRIATTASNIAPGVTTVRYNNIDELENFTSVLSELHNESASTKLSSSTDSSEIKFNNTTPPTATIIDLKLVSHAIYDTTVNVTSVQDISEFHGTSASTNKGNTYTSSNASVEINYINTTPVTTTSNHIKLESSTYSNNTVNVTTAQHISELPGWTTSTTSVINLNNTTPTTKDVKIVSNKISNNTVTVTSSQDISEQHDLFSSTKLDNKLTTLTTSVINYNTTSAVVTTEDPKLVSKVILDIFGTRPISRNDEAKTTLVFKSTLTTPLSDIYSETLRARSERLIMTIPDEHTEKIQVRNNDDTEITSMKSIVNNSTQAIEIVTATEVVQSKTHEMANEPMNRYATRTTTEKEEISGKRWTDSALFRKSEPVCHTSGCKSVGSRMLNLMDDSIDACEDFYAFSCGGMREENADSDPWSVLLRQTTQINDTSPKHLVTYKSFYNSCIDFHYGFNFTDRIEKVKTILKDKGLDTYEKAKILNLNDLLPLLFSVKSMHFMDIDVGINKQDTNKSILQLTLPDGNTDDVLQWSALWANQRRCLAEQRHKIYGSNLNLTEMHESYTECLGDHTEFENLLGNAIQAFGFQLQSDGVVHDTLTHIRKLLEIYPAISEISETKTNNKRVILKVSDLEKNYPSLNWTKMLTNVTQQNIEKNDLVQVYFKDYFKKWLKLFSQIKQKNTVLLNMLITDLYYNFVVPKINEDVEMHCIKTTAEIFSDISSSLYINHYSKEFVTTQKDRINKIFKKLVDNLKTAFTDIENISSYQKLNGLKVVFSKTATVDELERKYRHFSLGNSYPRNYIDAMEFNMGHRLMEMTKHENTVKSFDTTPTTFYETDSIYVPLGMVVNIPLGLPNYVTLSKIGLRLARAIAKHFDPIGIDYRMSFNSENYDALITSTDNIFELIKSKIINYTMEVNDKLSLNERIADNTAFRLITDIYPKIEDDELLPFTPKAFSKEKIMYILLAQEFCENVTPLNYMLRLYETHKLPGLLRVENMFQNSNAFAEAFNCPEGAGMNDNPFKEQTQFPHVVSNNEDYANIEEQ